MWSACLKSKLKGNKDKLPAHTSPLVGRGKKERGISHMPKAKRFSPLRQGCPQYSCHCGQGAGAVVSRPVCQFITSFPAAGMVCRVPCPFWYLKSYWHLSTDKRQRTQHCPQGGSLQPGFPQHTPRCTGTHYQATSLQQRAKTYLIKSLTPGAMKHPGKCVVSNWAAQRGQRTG